MKLVTATLLLAATIWLSGCADNLTISSYAVDSSDIYRKHTLVYDSEEDVLYARTRFSTGVFGPTVRLEPGSSVEFEGVRMKEAPSVMTEFWADNRRIEYYTKVINLTSSDNFEITWYRPDGNVVRDRIYLPSRIQIDEPRDGATFLRHQPLGIDWSGPALSSNEEVGVFNYDPFSRTEKEMFMVPSFIATYPGESLVIPGSCLYRSETVIQLGRTLGDAVACADSKCIYSESVYLSEPVHIQLR